MKVKVDACPFLNLINRSPLIYLTRNRFYNLAGMANNVLLRILRINKLVSSNQTSIMAEVI